MRYVLLICTDPTAPEYPDEDTSIFDWLAEVEASGVRQTGDRLREPSDATTIKVRGGTLSVTDGPFIETKEWIAGFDVLECGTLQEAIEIASRHPMARYGQIEIRPVWPLEAP